MQPQADLVAPPTRTSEESPEPARGRPLETSNEEPSPSEIRTPPPAAAASVVLPPNRNGYAVVVGRILDLIAKQPPSFIEGSRTVTLSRAAEGMLQDADAQQVGAHGRELARHGAKVEWRAFLRDHFKRKYDLLVLFDGAKMSLQ